MVGGVAHAVIVRAGKRKSQQACSHVIIPTCGFQVRTVPYNSTFFSVT